MSGRLVRVAALAAIVVGVAVRVGAARGDLWLDEVWSVLIARLAQSPLGVFVRVHHDNNNYLNTLWLMLVGGESTPLLCRGLALLSSTLVLALLAVRSLHGGALERAITTWLTASSYLLVHYGSEARGYAPAVLFSVAVFQAAGGYAAAPSWWWAAGFAVLGALGLLTHLTFVVVLTGTTAWLAVELARRRRLRPLPASSLLLLVPWAILALLWLVDIRYFRVGGGPLSSGPSVIRELVRTAHGLPHGPLELLSLVPLAPAGAELLRMARARDSRAVFFAVIALPVAAILAWSRPTYIEPRHFVVLVPFVFMLTGSWLARQATTGRAAAWAVAGLLLAFAVGNAFPVLRLIELGRGGYQAAVRTMLLRAPDALVTVGGDYDWRNMTVLLYHARALGAGGRFLYVPADGWGSAGPRFYLAHDFSTRPVAPAAQLEPHGITYQLVAVFPYAGLSGWSWLLYERAGPVLLGAPLP